MLPPSFPSFLLFCNPLPRLFLPPATHLLFLPPPRCHLLKHRSPPVAVEQDPAVPAAFLTQDLLASPSQVQSVKSLLQCSSPLPANARLPCVLRLPERVCSQILDDSVSLGAEKWERGERRGRGKRWDMQRERRCGGGGGGTCGESDHEAVLGSSSLGEEGEVGKHLSVLIAA
eukprot:764171-Hanusia_phi.AAC.8